MSKNKASHEETNRRIEEIRLLHDMGRKALQLSSDLTAAEADMLNRKPSLLPVARRFAVRYSQTELDTLCAQIAKHRPVFGTSHVGILIAVPQPKRHKLQTQCIQRNWSMSELKSSKARLFKARSRGGRHPQVTAANAPVLLAKQANSYCRLVARLMKPLPGKSCALDDMPPEMRASIKAGLPAMKRLRMAAQALLSTTQKAA
ncbi:MAG: hypothetical protein U0840_31165 [Gemmataceae bacterium]